MRRRKKERKTNCDYFVDNSPRTMRGSAVSWLDHLPYSIYLLVCAQDSGVSLGPDPNSKSHTLFGLYLVHLVADRLVFRPPNGPPSWTPSQTEYLFFLPKLFDPVIRTLFARCLNEGGINEQVVNLGFGSRFRGAVERKFSNNMNFASFPFA